jgi:cytidine deaminase
MVTHDELAGRALAARQHAYAPYSNHPVGATLLAADGRVFDGVSVENACIAAHICGTQGAFLNAVSQNVREFTAVAIATEQGAAPCGICRQMIAEFAPDITVLLVNSAGEFEELAFAEVMARPFAKQPV